LIEERDPERSARTTTSLWDKKDKGEEVGREIGCEMRMREMRGNERGENGGWKRERGENAIMSSYLSSPYLLFCCGVSLEVCMYRVGDDMGPSSEWLSTTLYLSVKSCNILSGGKGGIEVIDREVERE
jgi:hypothetical protein